MSMDVEYFEDIVLNVKHRSRQYYLDEKNIIEFAREWDPQPFHIDQETAKETRYNGLIASGVHLIVISRKLLNERMPQTAYIAGLAMYDFKWLSYARPGDAIILEMEAVSKRKSRSNENAGIVQYFYRLINQHGNVLLTFNGTALTKRKCQS